MFNEKEICVSAEDYGIDSKRLAELDAKMIDCVFTACGSEEEVEERQKELEEAGTERLKEIYDILQDFNQLEIAFYITHLVGATLQPDVLSHHNRMRMLWMAKKAQDTGEEKYAAIASRIAMSNIKDFLGGLFR